MSHVIEVDDLRAGYLDVVNRIFNYGVEVSPRGQKTLEIPGPVTIQINNPRDILAQGVGRKLNLGIGAAESCHLVGGVSDAVQMVSVAKNFGMFVEDGRLRGAYGPRLADQFPRVAALLKKDPDTRQAGVTLWRPEELSTPSKDVPCTMSLFFHIRAGRLNLSVTMRSNDVFWGLPYDAWMFSNALHTMAWAIGVPVGVYYHTALSLHAYVDRDAKQLAALHAPDVSVLPMRLPMLVDGLLARPTDSTPQDAAQAWKLAAIFARLACLNADTVHDASLPDGTRWYAGFLEKHVSAGVLGPDRYVMPRA